MDEDHSGEGETGCCGRYLSWEMRLVPCPGQYREDASMEVAQRIPGFDVVMMGHDHRRYCGKVDNIEEIPCC